MRKIHLILIKNKVSRWCQWRRSGDETGWPKKSLTARFISDKEAAGIRPTKPVDRPVSPVIDYSEEIAVDNAMTVLFEKYPDRSDAVCSKHFRIGIGWTDAQRAKELGVQVSEFKNNLKMGYENLLLFI